ncbi:DUF5133 domain-containing protein [Streptacidiphilus neutrinimicus]|uniref:DUF5133 domain-containing protein n=1 Tax=Streptacidiphilus neutrinimicus TaxID=105420 RepID=UPI000693410E|nr:DUF5133 domain-containing protein [Streptacidiphilus neutrinimicus]
MAHPTVLSALVEEYAALAALGAELSDDQARRLEDVTYTLCVATGTRDIDSALTTAGHCPPRAWPWTTPR